MASKRSLWANLPTLLLMAVVGGFIYDMVRRDNEQARQQHEADLAVQSSRGAVFARGDFAEMLALCREGWKGVSFHYEPVALAWTRQGLDAYFLQGTDATSVRQVHCDAQGVTSGPRVEHPLQEKLPAEAPGERDERFWSDWSAAITRQSAQKFGPGEVAFELLLHPFTGVALTRRWLGGPEGATATLDPADAAPFAFLPASGAFPVVGKAPAALKPLPRKRWIAQEGEAFALLARQLPKGARISELTLDEDEIDVQIEWKTKAFDGEPPVPYGDKSFDEYGLADMDWWYPREIPGFGCPVGAPLADVITSFGVAKAQRGGRPIERAWYSCSPAYSNGRSGTWHFAPSGS
jgi:hypothetical protein